MPSISPCLRGALSPSLCSASALRTLGSMAQGGAHTLSCVTPTHTPAPLVLCRRSGPLEWCGRSLRLPYAVRSLAQVLADLPQQAREPGSGSPHLGRRSRTRPEPVLAWVSRHPSAATLGGSSLERPTEPLGEPRGMTCGLTLSEMVAAAPFSMAGKCSLQENC